ncbi:PAS domain-containing protein [Pseudonocardia sp. KRD-184]|uniref:histidine kinase n=1 Tax=Pseudonocardia oceani TaxID=2792013 RepID=A0ABS6UHS8_9PSEU|nr:PAS domain-containing protein [Pseudonocardia oceani]MBW0088771.1 PAS domain-containing protein [Pseudonocardia oceani]MBW0096370.1 PAS domain-containing protein [Pseudonocardia oceani]MBW0107341.1 PAS domain-containing protein [Pseudonocardia oceani]MBW0122438.1 PAS domain-containing protein [Pseudonocardia oceani]MBW0131473.1 PAS domain-containing protein [Pseudonocardia oceani]
MVDPLPAPFAALLAAREDGTTLWSVWGFDSYFRDADQRLLELLGWTEAELSSASYWDFVHADDQHPLVEALERMMTTAGTLEGYEMRVLGRDGGWRRMRWDMVADRETELVFSVGARIETGESVDGVARPLVGTWAWQGRAGTFTWSDELYDMFGLPIGTALTDALIRSRIHPQDHPLVEQVWRARLADGDAHGVRFRTVLPDGTTRHVECTGRATAGRDDHAFTIRGITVDVTAALADSGTEVGG